MLIIEDISFSAYVYLHVFVLEVQSNDIVVHCVLEYFEKSLKKDIPV